MMTKGILKLMEAMDTNNLSNNEMFGKLSTLEKEMNAKKEELDRFLMDVDKNIEGKNKEREEFVGKIKPSLLKKYNMIKQKKDYSDVLAKIIGYICGSCNMHIPPQMVNEIKGMKQMHVCPTCERILYWSQDDETND